MVSVSKEGFYSRITWFKIDILTSTYSSDIYYETFFGALYSTTFNILSGKFLNKIGSKFNDMKKTFHFCLEINSNTLPDGFES